MTTRSKYGVFSWFVTLTMLSFWGLVRWEVQEEPLSILSLA